MMEFEWDDRKRQENLRVRKLDFGRAMFLFRDPYRVEWEDVRRDYGELRFNMLAKHEGRVFALTFTLRGRNVRVISLRKANAREQRNMSGQIITRAVLIGDEVYERMADGSLKLMPDRTDWAAVDATTEEEINRQAEEDGTLLTEEEWAKVKFIEPHKLPVTIRLDSDIVAWFKAQGERGYQTRINAVLRHYMDANSKS